MAQILLRNGTALLHQHDNSIEAARRDILVIANKIAEIGRDIKAPNAEVIDCENSIVSPGFIDTHHHVWQTPLKGRHADQTFVQYMASGNLTAKTFDSDDVFWGQLAGCMEMIDCGTTTVADYAHLNISPEHNYKAIAATVASGLRSSFGYCPNPRLKTTNPFQIDTNGLGGHTMSTFAELAKSSPWGNGRVTLGFAFDGFAFAPKDQLDVIMAKVAEYRIPLIQTHYGWHLDRPSLLQKIEADGFLDERFLISHSIGSEDDVKLFHKHGMHFSSTPSTEQQMSITFPASVFRENTGIQDLGSLGVDCHSNNSAFIPGEARIGLQGARAARGQVAARDGKIPARVEHTVSDAFNLATIHGASAMRMADKIGSIEEGKVADLVVLKARSPSMVCAAEHDPVAAIMLHSSPADVETVIIDGVIRKRDGELQKLIPDGISNNDVTEKEEISWDDVAQHVLQARERIQAKIEAIDFKIGEREVMDAFGISDTDLADP